MNIKLSRITKFIVTLGLLLFMMGCTTMYTYRGQKFADIPTALSHINKQKNNHINSVYAIDEPIVSNDKLVIEFPSPSGFRNIIRSSRANVNQTPEVQDYVADAFGILVEGMAQAAIKTKAFEEHEIKLTSNYHSPSNYRHSSGWSLVSIHAPPSGLAKWMIYSPSGSSNLAFDMERPFPNDGAMFKAFVNDFLRTTERLAKREEVELEKRQIREKAELERERLENLAISPAKGSGRWKKQVETDPITDARVVSLRLDAKESYSSYKGRTSLTVRCNDKKIELYIDFDDYMTDSAFVSSRVDKQEPEKKLWSSSTDKTAVFYPTGEMKTFIRQLFNASKFVVRATPYNENPKTLTFDIRGLYSKLKPYENECGW